VTIVRTTHGIPHITAPDMEGVAFGAAYAHAQDNICQNADHLMTVRGQRSLHFGESGVGIMGVRGLPNAQIDAFIAAHMDDARLAALWAAPPAQTTKPKRGAMSQATTAIQQTMLASCLPRATANRGCSP
jgi:acyl-homoserine-lactone acylase